MPRCVAPFCGKTGGKGLGMFKFPDDSSLNLQWRVKMGRGKTPTDHTLWTSTKWSRLCSDHFEECCFVVSPRQALVMGYDHGKLQLTPGAVPTIFTRKDGPTATVQKVRPSSERRKRRAIVMEILAADNEENSPGTTPDVPCEQPITDSDTLTHVEPPTHVEQPTNTSTDPKPSIETPTAQSAVDEGPFSDLTNIPRPKKQTYTKTSQTPTRWHRQPPTHVRSFGIQASCEMVDKGTQCDLVEPHPPPAVKTTPPPTDKPDDSVASDQSAMEEDGYLDQDDPDYLSEMDMDISDDESDPEAATPITPHPEPQLQIKYIVFESSIVELLNVCATCGGNATVSRTCTRGALVVMVSVCCRNNNHRRLWQNQPSHNGLPVGNLLTAAAILFSGSSPVKALNMLMFLKVQTFHMRTFYNLQSAYLLPAIESVWSSEQRAQLEGVTQPLKLGGDARCCSPGHTAKYGSYTLMDLQTSRIMDMQLVQSNEVADSNAMELEGLKRCLNTLDEAGVTILELTSDRHPQVKKFLREQRPDINHWFDVWHVAKGVKKKVDAAAKRKGCEILSQWSQSISNHMYYSAALGHGDGALVVEIWTSLMNHIVDIHDGHGLKYPSCQHGELDDREWLKKDSKPHKELRDVIERKALLKDIQKLSAGEQTYGLESFHKMCCFFATKFVHFFYLSMAGRLKLACLHFNENAGRPQTSAKTGSLQWRVYTPKFKKGTPVAKQIKVSQTYNYVDRLLSEVLARREEFPTYKTSKADLQPVLTATPAPVCAQYGPVDKAAVVAAHRSRFNMTD